MTEEHKPEWQPAFHDLLPPRVEIVSLIPSRISERGAL